MRLRAMILALPLLVGARLPPRSAQDWRGGKARVDGTVKNDKGEPIEGCKVVMRWGKSSHGGPDLTTDAKGQFAIFGLAGGPWDVDFEAPGYQTEEDQREPAGGRPQRADRRAARSGAQAAPAPRRGRAAPQIMVGGKKISKETADAIEAGNAAMTREELGGRARELPQGARRSCPTTRPLLQRIAAAYLAEGNTDEALRYARQAAEKDPAGRRRPWRMIAEIELQKGNLEAGPRRARQGPGRQDHRSAAVHEHRHPPYQQEEAGRGRVAPSTRRSRSSPTAADAYYYRGLCRHPAEEERATRRPTCRRPWSSRPTGPTPRTSSDLLKYALLRRRRRAGDNGASARALHESSSSLWRSRASARRSPPRPRAQEPGPVRETAEVSLVEVPVRVLDRDGAAACGASTAADFTVQDDGRQQAIVGFDAIDLAEKVARRRRAAPCTRPRAGGS